MSIPSVTLAVPSFHAPAAPRDPLPSAHYQRCSTSAHPGRMQGENQIIIQVRGVSADVVTLLFSVCITFPSGYRARPDWADAAASKQQLTPRWMEAAMIGCLMFSVFLSQRPARTEESSDTCRTTLQCWREMESL